jgi:hypothetical protein
MEQETLYILYTTFFIWFLSWTLLESVMNYYKIRPLSKIKLVFVLLVMAVINYLSINRDKDPYE